MSMNTVIQRKSLPPFCFVMSECKFILMFLLFKNSLVIISSEDRKPEEVMI